MTGYVPPRTVMVTGAFGNLGRKLIHHFAEQAWCDLVVAVDRGGEAGPFLRHGKKVRYVVGDLRTLADRRWRDALKGVDAVVHFAAQRPYEDATWTDVAASIDMTVNLLDASLAAGVRRFAFATSNHVMGGYKDEPLAGTIGPGTLTTALAPAPGTHVRVGERKSDSTPYATTKLVGERLCVAKAAMSEGKLTTVSARIGWCQPGENKPGTINLTGTPGVEATPPRNAEEERDLRWFRNMWLSNRDFLDLFERAVLADPAPWPAPGIVVNGMSANRGMGWEIETTKTLLGYAPRDDMWAQV